MNIEKLQAARELAYPVPQVISAVDKDAAIIIQYVPTLGSASTNTASFTLSGDSFQFLVAGDTPSGNDAIGTAGKIDLTAAAYDTIGELADYINGLRAWRCIINAAKRSLSSIYLLAKTSTRCDGDTGTTVYLDTSDMAAHYVCISGEAFINNGKNGHVKDADDYCENALLYGSYLQASSSNGLSIKYYSGAQNAAEVALTGSISMTEATQLEHGEENHTEPFIKAKFGERLLIEISNASTDLGTPTTSIVGRTAVLKGNRLVTDINYGDA